MYISLLKTKLSKFMFTFHCRLKAPKSSTKKLREAFRRVSSVKLVSLVNYPELYRAQTCHISMHSRHATATATATATALCLPRPRH